MANATEVGWVDGPDGRGTMTIIWTCLSTLLLCIWSSWHPDVPSTPARAKFWRRTLDKICMVLCLLVVPEAGVATAMHQAAAAYLTARMFRENDYPQWTMAHCFYAEMGGVYLDVGRAEGERQGTWDRYCERLGIERLLWAFEDDKLPKTPPITAEEIGELSKADFLAKAIALGQVVWFLVSLVARKAQGLAISQMEVTVAAYVFYAAVVYVAWWRKPLDVTSVSLIAIPGMRMPSQSYPMSDGIGTKNVQTLVAGFSQYNLDSWRGLLYIVVFAIFGGIHCAAWNANFQSAAERTLWRISSLVLVLSYALWLVLGYIEDWVCTRIENGRGRQPANMANYLAGLLGYSLVVLYFAARLYILIEAVLALRRAPASLYETVDWSKYLPHIA